MVFETALITSLDSSFQ